MKAGPEFDALIHEKHFGRCAHEWATVTNIVMGGRHLTRQCSKCKAFEPLVVHVETPKYSTDITAAWTVMENERKRGGYISIAPLPDGKWRAVRTKALNPNGDGTADDYDDTYPDFQVEADTAPMAICMSIAHFFLEEEVMADYLVDCWVCGGTKAQGHAPGCSVVDLSPEMQRVFMGKKA